MALSEVGGSNDRRSIGVKLVLQWDDLCSFWTVLERWRTPMCPAFTK